MTDRASPYPTVNGYGKLIAGCLLAGVGATVLGSSMFVSAGFVLR